MKTFIRADVTSPDWEDYALLDTGGGLKLERFGAFCFIRPEPQATWRPARPASDWAAAHAVFEAERHADQGRWQFRREVPPRWDMHYRHLRFWAAATPYRHLGLFPEQAGQWDWLAAQIASAGRPVRVLNLFGYTGLATLAAAAAGAAVTHVDSSRKALTWGRDNQILSGLADRPVRWLLDDALKFARREVRRGAVYDGFILDPPPFGRGPDGELWRFAESLPLLLAACRDLLSDQPLFLILTAYTARTSVPELAQMVSATLAGRGGQITAGDALLTEHSAGRVLKAALFARWQAVAAPRDHNP